MKTQHQIELDYKKTIKQAEDIAQIAKDLQAAIDNKYKQAIHNIDKDWKSDNTTAFFKKGTMIQTNLEEYVKKLTKASSTLKTIAQNIYDAEMEAFRIAQERSYKG